MCFTEAFSRIRDRIQVILSHQLAIQPEVLLNQINVDSSGSFSAVYKFKHVDKIQLKYLSIPILLNYRLVKFLTLQAGPQFGILMNQHNTVLENGTEAFKSGDLSILTGVQVNIRHLNIYGRYAFGLTDLNNIDKAETWKSRSIQVGVGLTL